MNRVKNFYGWFTPLLILACLGCQIANQKESSSNKTESAVISLSARTHRLLLELAKRKNLNQNLYSIFRLFGNDGYEFWYSSSEKYIAELSSDRNAIFVSGPPGYVKEIKGLIAAFEGDSKLVAENFIFTTPTYYKYNELCKRLGLVRRAKVN